MNNGTEIGCEVSPPKNIVLPDNDSSIIRDLFSAGEFPFP